jgi:hypothetical protein
VKDTFDKKGKKVANKPTRKISPGSSPRDPDYRGDCGSKENMFLASPICSRNTDSPTQSTSSHTTSNSKKTTTNTQKPKKKKKLQLKHVKKTVSASLTSNLVNVAEFSGKYRILIHFIISQSYVAM